MVKERLISKEEALMRLEPEQLNQLLHPNFDPQAEKGATVLARGLPASPRRCNRTGGVERGRC